MAARRKAPTKIPPKLRKWAPSTSVPKKPVVWSSTSESEDDEEQPAPPLVRFNYLKKANMGILDESDDPRSEEDTTSELEERPTAMAKHILPVQVSREIHLYGKVPKCTAYDPLTPQPLFELKTPCTMPGTGLKYRLKPKRLLVHDSPLRPIRGVCCKEEHYQKVKVDMEYPLSLKFKAFLSHSCITRLLQTEASTFFADSNNAEEKSEMERKAQSAFKLVHEAKNPTLLVSYSVGTFLISAVSLKKNSRL